MRVISGTYKGRILKTVKNFSVRPATDRVKQTLFDMLATRLEMDDATVLDLFAGSGGLGIEALSRGAAHVTFVEHDEEAALYIEKNLYTLGCEDRTAIVETDAVSFVRRCKDSFDLIFADPPYLFPETPELPRLILGQQMLTRNGYLLIEHTTDIQFETTELFHAGPEKRFGRTVVTFFRHHEQE
ncbi:MAG: 16S rRNA (guanine(966)-N(2))-methyltransferase RsmD [Bacteroidetes bacterium]|nr:16S rRNA (guanine(966)-N(2))-methyltransferase RsmD [Bacteroidota bacterium]MCW5895971.1 16S rRNA (guanine(966)-N(2))-methyltransferase RsmD [Bacteroidota bacterium]